MDVLEHTDTLLKTSCFQSRAFLEQATTDLIHQAYLCLWSIGNNNVRKQTDGKMVLFLACGDFPPLQLMAR